MRLPSNRPDDPFDPSTYHVHKCVYIVCANTLVNGTSIALCSDNNTERIGHRVDTPSLCTRTAGGDGVCGYLLCKNSLLSCPARCAVDVGGLLLMGPRTPAVNAKTSVVYRLLYTLPGLPPPVRPPHPSRTPPTCVCVYRRLFWSFGLQCFSTTIVRPTHTHMESHFFAAHLLSDLLVYSYRCYERTLFSNNFYEFDLFVSGGSCVCRTS